MSRTGDSARARIEIEFVVGATPIEGTIRGADGVDRAFAGWLDLLTALDHFAEARAKATLEGGSRRPRREA